MNLKERKARLEKIDKTINTETFQLFYQELNDIIEKYQLTQIKT